MDQRVLSLLTVMKADPRPGLGLRRMAQTVNLSTPHLCYLFKTETGTSPARYFKLDRMEYSSALLTSTFLSVKEIMLLAGFNDESHFVRDFKKIYGQTPTEYRKSAANGSVRSLTVREGAVHPEREVNQNKRPAQPRAPRAKREEPKLKTQPQSAKPKDEKPKTNTVRS